MTQSRAERGAGDKHTSSFTCSPASQGATLLSSERTRISFELGFFDTIIQRSRLTALLDSTPFSSSSLTATSWCFEHNGASMFIWSVNFSIEGRYAPGYGLNPQAGLSGQVVRRVFSLLSYALSIATSLSSQRWPAMLQADSRYETMSKGEEQWKLLHSMIFMRIYQRSMLCWRTLKAYSRMWLLLEEILFLAPCQGRPSNAYAREVKEWRVSYPWQWGPRGGRYMWWPDLSREDVRGSASNHHLGCPTVRAISTSVPFPSICLSSTHVDAYDH